jgi:DNA-binding MarR family transcriptional regulator
MGSTVVPKEVIGKEVVQRDVVRKEGAGARRRTSPEDERAAELLLAFARTARNPRDASGLPESLEALSKSGDLAPRHVGLFAVISLLGPLTVSELAARGGFALSTTSLLVSQLAEVGLVVRSESEEDRRRTVVSVAPAHRREGEAVVESKLAPLRRALARMGPERAQALLEGLGVLAEEVAAPRAPARPAAPGDRRPGRTT